MPLQVTCTNPQCRKPLLVKDDLVGKTLLCPACRTAFAASAERVPTPAGAPAVSLPAKKGSTIDTVGSASKGTAENPPAKPPAGSGAKSAPPARKPGLPAAIGPYQVTRELGRGAFGVVYQGRDTKLQRDVAIKVLNLNALKSEKAVGRFLREAQVVAQMHHNNVVPVYELGEHEGCHYIASRFVPGKTLAQLIPEKGMEPARAVKLVLQLLEGLAYAHKMGVLHRDVKPDNAIVDDEGQLYLMDFGLAGWIGQEEGRTTQDGTVMGTASYMPPEQARGAIHQVSEASDQYSAGVVLYELLTGNLPFEGPVYVVLHNAIETPPPPPSRFRPDLDPQLETLCLKALAKKPEERFPNCREFAETLRTWQALHGSPGMVVLAPVIAEPGPVEVEPVEVKPIEVKPKVVPARPSAVRPKVAATMRMSAKDLSRVAPAAPVDEAEEPDEEDDKEADSPDPSRRTWLLVGGGIALLSVLGAGGYVLSRLANPRRKGLIGEREGDNKEPAK